MLGSHQSSPWPGQVFPPTVRDCLAWSMWLMIWVVGLPLAVAWVGLRKN